MTSPAARMRPLLRAVRPRQWVKNLLVAAGPIAGGAIGRDHALLHVLLAFGCFCLASSGVYLVNDVLDRGADRQHPTKRLRPVASGELRVGTATTVGTVLLVAAPGFALAAGRWQLAVTLGVYVILQLAYCWWLKHITVVDLAVVSSGFLLRAIAGGTATGVALSPLFLSVASFGSLFMVAGKRYSEVHLVGEGAGHTRRSLLEYSPSYLRFVWSIAGAATLTFYALWAFSSVRSTPLWAELSVAPFVIALLRYAVDIDRGAAGEPEEIVLRDRVLQVIGLLWIATFLVQVAVG